MRNMLGLLATAAAAIFGMVDLVSANVVYYDLVADWSNSQNPNGPWSYNHNNIPISAFQYFWWGASGWCYNTASDGAIYQGAPNTPVSGPPHDWQSSDIVIHALSEPYGGRTTFANIKWTSPDDGAITISGRAWEVLFEPDRDVAWTLLLNDQVIAARSTTRGIYRTDAVAPFSANLLPGRTLTGLSVNPGDIVEFSTATNTYYGHYVGVDLNIALTTIPEPATLLLLALGGAILQRRK